MIPANELRIGDWAYDNKLNGNVKFTSFYGLCNVENNPDDYDPIPLTPEVLEKCGFEMRIEETGPPINDSTEIWENKWLECLFDNHGALILNGSNFDMNRPKYLHQLQNLYFALTGEELTVKL